MARLSIRNLEKTYGGGFKAVHGINLEVEDGEFMVLVGPSGCAKSTTLRMIAGLETVTGGQILIGDTVVNNLTPGDRGIAMVFQNYALYPHMKVRKNLSFGLRLAGEKKDEIERRVAEVAEVLEIGPLLDRLPKQLSGGQAQRVALGRALIKKPQVFLFDEPLSNLDAFLRVQMRIEIARLHQRIRSTMVYVTHDQVEAMTLADRLVVLNAGRIEQIGTPLKVYRKPASTFVAGFIGSPAMNLISSRAVPYLPGSAQAATIGIRPEDLSVAPDGPIEMDVMAVEELGAQRLVHGQTGGERLTVAMPSDAALSDSLRLAWRPGSLHLFQADGRRIG